MTLIVLFDGQGEQRREHVERLLQDPATDFREPLDRLLQAQGVSLATVTDETVRANRVAQPTICAYQLTIWSTLAPLLPRPALFAGYSLGELTAFSCAGAIAVQDTVPLAAIRARLMDDAVGVPSGLLAVSGLDENALFALCRGHGAEIAIRNGFDAFIVGGASDALERVAVAASAAGAHRVTRLGVPTPSHTSQLTGAARAFAAELRPKLRERLDVPALSGIEGKVVRSGAAAAAALERQMCRTIDWAACMETIVSYRPQAVLEVGPGSALSRLLREREPQLEVRAVDDFRAPAAAAAWARARVA